MKYGSPAKRCLYCSEYIQFLHLHGWKPCSVYMYVCIHMIQIYAYIFWIIHMCTYIRVARISLHMHMYHILDLMRPSAVRPVSAMRSFVSFDTYKFSAWHLEHSPLSFEDPSLAPAYSQGRCEVDHRLCRHLFEFRPHRSP